MSKDEKKSMYGFLTSALNSKIDKGNNSHAPKESKPGTSSAMDKNEFKSTSKAKEKKVENSKSNDDKGPKDPNLPDRSYGDYFCPTCDSHMNSENMWTAHIIGKRHLKNIKKDETDSKYNDLDVEATGINDAVRKVREPVVGLSYIHEIRRREPNVPPIYNCFLCHASLSTIELVIQHVISYKHRLNYIKENNPKEHFLIEKTGLNKVQKSSLVEEACQKLEVEKGRGSVKVKQEKPKKETGYYKRSYSSDDSDYDGNQQPHKSQRRDDTKPYLWKAIDSGKSSGSGFHDLRERLSHRSGDDRRSTTPKRKDSPERFKSRDKFYNPKKHEGNANYEPIGPRIQKPVVQKEDYYPRPEKEDYYPRPEKEEYYPRPQKEEYYPRPQKEEYYPRPEEQFHPISRTSSVRSSSILKNSLPHEIAQPTTSSTSDSFNLKQFVQHMFALPAEVFLKIALSRLESMDIKGIEELSLLSQLIQKSQKLLCNKLPVDVQNVLKQKMSMNAELPVQRMTPPVIMPQTEKPSTSQDKQTDFSFIKDLLSNVKRASSASVENSNQHLNYPNREANLYQNQSTNLYPNQNTNSYPNQNTNSYPNQSTNLYPNQSTSSYTNQIANSYQPQAGMSQVEIPPNAIPTYNFPSQGQNNYSSAQPNFAPTIPGLNLAQNPSSSEPYSSYQSHYSSSDPDARKNHPYGY